MKAIYKSVISFLCLMILCVTLYQPAAFSKTLLELQREKEQVDTRKKVLSTELDKSKHELDHNSVEIDNTKAELNRISHQLYSTLNEIDKVSDKINQTGTELEELHNSVMELEKKLSSRDLILRERIRTIQASGGILDYIDVLLGSSSFADLISRYSSTATLLRADRLIIEKQAEDVAELETIKNIIAQKLEEQRMNNLLLQKSQASLETKKGHVSQSLEGLEEKNEYLRQAKEKIEKDISMAVERSSELEREILSLQNRQITVQPELATNVTYSKSATCSEAGGLNEDLFFARFEAAGVFTGQGQLFIDVAREYNIDPVLMAAIAFHETGVGTSRAVVQYNNPGGLMNPATNWSTLIRFDTLKDGVRSTAKTLNKLVYKGGLTSISDLGSVYAPIGAANDPNGLNIYWSPNVTKFVNELGGLTTSCR